MAVLAPDGRAHDLDGAERGPSGEPSTAETRKGCTRFDCVLLRSRAVRVHAEATDRGRWVRCDEIAPALVPRKPGEPVKTDRRDARKLAELHRADLLTVVRAPTPAGEAVRDLCRARDDARADRQRCRHRLGKLLLTPRACIPGARVDAGASALGQWFDVATSSRPGGGRRLPAGDRPARSPAVGAGRAVGRGGGHRAVSGAGGLVAVLPRHRHADGGVVARRAARCAAVSDGAGADGVSGVGARRALQRGSSPPRADHEDGQKLGAAAGGRGGVALSAPARGQPATRPSGAAGSCRG